MTLAQHVWLSAYCSKLSSGAASAIHCEAAAATAVRMFVEAHPHADTEAPAMFAQPPPAPLF